MIKVKPAPSNIWAASEFDLKKLVAGVTKFPVTKPPVTKPGRAKRYETPAQKQKAYRERKRGR